LYMLGLSTSTTTSGPSHGGDSLWRPRYVTFVEVLMLDFLSFVPP
jgi:hypothetical protein